MGPELAYFTIPAGAKAECERVCPEYFCLFIFNQNANLIKFTIAAVSWIVREWEYRTLGHKYIGLYKAQRMEHQVSSSNWKLEFSLGSKEKSRL